MERIRAPKTAPREAVGRSDPGVEQLASAIGNRAFALLARQPRPAAQAPARARELHAEAQRLYEAENFREALAVWERARETAGVTEREETAFLFNIGMCNLRLERFATAIFFFEEYLEAPGADVALGGERLARARAGAGVPESDARGRRDPRALHRRAQRAFDAGEYARALVLWERARQVPNLSEREGTAFLFNVGMSNLMLERYGSAVAVFEEYLERPSANREVGEEWLRRARAGVGASEASEAPIEEPDDLPGQALHRQAQRLFDDESYREALAVWERAREAPGTTDRQRAAFMFNIGMCNLMLERYATAILFFEQYLEAPVPGTNQDMARRRLGQARRGAGVEAAGGQRDPHSLHGSAQRLFDAGDYRRALILWERARQRPNLSERERAAFLFNVGACNLMLERFGSAVAAFEEYLESPEANRELGRDRLARARAGVGAPVSAVSPSSSPSSPSP